MARASDPGFLTLVALGLSGLCALVIAFLLDENIKIKKKVSDLDYDLDDLVRVLTSVPEDPASEPEPPEPS